MARDEGLPVDPEKIDVVEGERDRIVVARSPTSREHLDRGHDEPPTRRGRLSVFEWSEEPRQVSEAFAKVGKKYGGI